MLRRKAIDAGEAAKRKSTYDVRRLSEVGDERVDGNGRRRVELEAK